MKIIVTESYEEMCREGAKIMLEVVKSKPNAVLGLATGSTPVGLYKLLAEACKNGATFSNVTTVNLDEYVGLPKSHDQSYAYFMRKNLFDVVDVLQKNTNIPCGTAEDLAAECRRYSALLAQHPQDVQLLGLGPNGHVGFNEPGTPFDSTTHVVALTESTIAANARFFNSAAEVPKQAVTMGIAEIMAAKQILLLASGENKAEAVAAMVNGPVSEACPASILQRHENAIIILDRAAAKLL